MCLGEECLFFITQHLDMEEDTKSLKGQLLSVCTSLEQLPSLDPLLAVWQGVRVRMFMHYQLSARAYFTFLKLSGTQSVYAPGNNKPVFLVSLLKTRCVGRSGRHERHGDSAVAEAAGQVCRGA